MADPAFLQHYDVLGVNEMGTFIYGFHNNSLFCITSNFMEYNNVRSARPDLPDYDRYGDLVVVIPKTIGNHNYYMDNRNDIYHHATLRYIGYWDALLDEMVHGDNDEHGVDIGPFDDVIG
jgi:hypothetical protein